jgi:hypothetical protein
LQILRHLRCEIEGLAPARRLGLVVDGSLWSLGACGGLAGGSMQRALIDPLLALPRGRGSLLPRLTEPSRSFDLGRADLCRRLRGFDAPRRYSVASLRPSRIAAARTTPGSAVGSWP